MAKKLAMKLRRSISMLLAVLMVISVITPVNVSAAPVEPSESCPICGAFTDVETDGWYHEAVDFVVGGNLMNGVSADEFAPNEDLLRAQFVTIIWRMAGQPKVEATNTYPDVEEGRYYTDAVLWATAEGIVTGYKNGNFGVEDSITREQVAAILWRLAGEPAAEAELTFDDAAEVSNYATVAVKWAVEEGLLQGYKNELNPTDTATRAQIAQILVRYLSEEPEVPVDPEGTIDLDAVESLPYDCSQAAQLPMTGYMTKAIGEDRTAKVYISENASIRSYFTIVAVPDGVNTYEFLEESGWIDIAEAEGECLFVLEPGAEGWGTAKDEAAYVDAAIGFLRNPKNDNKVTLFSTFGEFYVVGYGAGAPAVERWVAANPILAISQVYVDAEGLEAAYLNELGAPVYYGSKAEGSGRETKDEIFEIVGGKLLKRSEIPVPAWFINYGADSVAYWQAANDVVAANVYDDAVLGKVYPQDIASTAYATTYANTRLAAAGEKNGLAKVAVLETEEAVAAEDLYAFLSYYTRYDTTMAYSNALGLRLEYSDAIIAAQTDAKDGEVKEVVGGYDIWALESTIVPQTGATMYAGIGAFADNAKDEDPAVDPREFLLYVPESAQAAGHEAPVIFVWPGNSQTDIIFTDATLWWQIAEEEGVIIAMVCETYSSNSVSVSHADNNDMYAMIKAVLAEKLDGKIADIDFTRLYSTGQSAGSAATQTFAQTKPEFFAAVASTSAGSLNKAPVYQPIPSYMLHGLGDGNGGYIIFEEENTLRPLANYYLAMNGLGSLDNFTAEETQYSYDFLEGEYIYDAARYAETYDFAGDDGISLVRYTRTSMRPHNCYPEEMWLMWDFMKNFSFEVAEDGTVTRYYSESAFEEIDKIQILDNTIADMDDVLVLPYDCSQAAQLPLTGYFTKEVAEGRTVKVYISEEASVRSYFTVVAVPDGVDTTEFLEAEGWFDVADEKGEGLFVMEPGAEGWGTVAEELSYVTAAMNFFKSGRNANKVTCFSVFGEFYFVGYGEACAPLEAYAAEYPIFVISQAYFEGEGAGQRYLDANGAETYDGKNTGGYDPIPSYKEDLAAIGADVISKSEVPVPTWFAGYADSDYSVSYWKAANDVVATPEMGVYRQDINSDAMQTNYANKLLKEEGSEYGISEVIVNDDVDADAAAIYAWLSTFTRYDNTFAYSNALGYRLDYTAATVEAQQEFKNVEEPEIMEYTKTGGEKGIAEVYSQASVEVGNGEVVVGIMAFADNSRDGKDDSYDPREYLMYIPDSAKEAGEEGAPVVIVWPGNSQTDRIFMDATMWWPVADKEGFVLVFVCETYSSNSVSVSHADSDLFYYALSALLEGQISEDFVKIDMSRVYATGQSAGSMTSQGFARTNPEFFAAVASTSGGSTSATTGYIPSYLIIGQSDLGMLMPDLWGNASVKAWADGLFAANGMDADINNWTSANTEGRFHTYVWENAQGVPMVQYGETQMRTHNCYPEEMPLMWDYMKKFSFDKDENGYVTARYYSESAFAEDDAVEIKNPAEAPEAAPITETVKAPSTIGSYQRINGYYSWSVKANDEERAIEVYIPEGARQREYWVTMTLPEGVDSGAFLEETGWFDIADESLACLLILMPGEEGYGSVEEELAYVDAAMATLKSNGTYYSAFTYNYLVGYAEGAPALQLWAAKNPLKMISQVYVNAAADADYMTALNAAGETQIKATAQPNNMDFEGYKDKDGNEITQKRTFEALYNNDIAIPTWFAGVEDANLMGYWMAANDCLAEAVADEAYGKVYWQDKENSDCVTTSFSDIKTQVAVAAEEVDMESAELTQNIYNFLTYYSGYDNNSSYGHFITKRLDYDKEIAEGDMVYADHMWNGTNRVYMVYIPENVDAAAAPVVFANHGAGQTAFVFMEATDIKEAADKYGFVAVTFDLTSNAQYMVDLVELVVADCAKLGVTVDRDRLYAYGQSAGGGATANTLAQSPLTVDLFAAFASTSGTQTQAQKDGSEKIVPFFAIYGEYDYWPMKLGPVEAGEWTGSMGGRGQYVWSTNTQTYWANRLFGLTLDEAIASADVEDGIGASIVPENTPVDIIVNPTAEVNRYKYYSWSNADGAPLFTWGQCFGRGHNLVPSDLNEIWENCFSKWEKGAEADTLNYWADGIGNGEAIVVDQAPYVADLDDITSVPMVFNEAAQLPMTGYFTKEVMDGRTVKVYISEDASIRSYFTVVAVPDGVDTEEFLEAEGWFDVADEKGEGLFIMEPGKDGWGTMEEELSYVTAAMNFFKSGRNANRVTCFSVYGEFYFVGYGAACAPLEAYAAEYPIFVISQVYIDGEGAGQNYLDSTGAKEYDGRNTSGYDPEIENFDETLAALGWDYMTRSEVPVPTWFAGYEANDYSISYWKAANDVVATPEAGVYRQDINSKALQTTYANECLKAEGSKYGISEVVVNNDVEADAAAIYAWLATFTRYDNTFAYSNALGYRLDYTAATVEAQQAAKAATEYGTLEYTKTGGEKGTAELWSQASVEVGNGEMIVGVMAFADNTNDGKDDSFDPREYIVYVPESAKTGKAVPVVMVYPGNSQTDRIFMDSTMWWKVADNEGFVVAIICETYNKNAVSVSHYDSDLFYYALTALLTGEDFANDYGVQIDKTRIYGTGQSAGSNATQGFARTNPEFFAAVASTSFANTKEAKGYIPVYLITGQSDLNNIVPDLWTAPTLQSWAEGLFEVNGIDTDINSWTSSNTEGRFHVYSWENEQGIEMVKWGQTQSRAHNCYPAEMPMLYDYMKHFSVETDELGNVTARYYSPSAFTSSRNDKVLINNPADAAAEAAELKAQVESIQAYTMPNFYGQRLYQIEVTFAEGTDMEAAANADIYGVWDRAFNDGAWERGDIDAVTVEGNVVTLHFDQDPANNAPFSMLTTMNWSVRTIYNEAGEITGYAVANKADQGLGKDTDPSGSRGKDYLYFTRENLDLVLDISVTPKQANGLALTDGFGNFNEEGLWLETVNDVYDDYELALVDAVEGDEMRYTKYDGKVPVHYQVPESYDAEVGMPLVLYVTGNGTSYWEAFDEYGNLVSNNEGTNLTYDNSTASWIAGGDVIVASPDVHSDNNKWAGEELANAIKWFEENYNITKVVIMGNSNGTGICSQCMRDFPELVDVFICYNGWIADGPVRTCVNTATWPEERKQAIAEEGVAIWVIQGETDPLANPVQALQSYKHLIPYYQAAGWSDEWIAENLRISAFKSYKFQEWGVNDHSCVKMASWNYINTPYLDVYENEAPLAVGDTYYMENARAEEVREFAYVTYPDSIHDWALGSHEEVNVIDLDAIEVLPYDCSQAAQLPLTGYMTKAIGDRTAKVYISENASIRSYFTIVAAPEGIDTYKFLEESGWIDIAEAQGECLFILEPGAEGWGTAVEESAYVNAAISFLRNPKNANNVTLFSTFGEFYVVGYGAGAPAIEAWAAANPILVISQVYMDAEGLDAAYLNELGADVYYGSKAEGSGRETKDEIYEIVDGKLLKRSEIPVPTWFINYGTDSVNYWKTANDVITNNVYGDEILGQVYPQDIKSTAYATTYANTRLAAAGEKYGLAKVAVKADSVDYYDVAATEDMYAFLTYYTRYDTTMAYSNALGQRLEYSDAIMAAQNDAKDGVANEVLAEKYEIWALESTIVPQTGATMYAGIGAFADNTRDEDPGIDPREFLLYVPESAQAEGHKAPVIFVWPGNSQTDIIFTDATLWWQIAEEEGVIIAMVCETYSSNSVSVSHADNNDMYAMIKAVLAEKLDGEIADIDFGRLYSTGQSAGSAATQTFAQTKPEFYAAVASTSAGSLNKAAVYEPIPSYMLHGLGDGNGGYIIHEAPNTLRPLANYYLGVNGLGSLDDYTAEETQYSYDFLEGKYIYDAARYADTYDFATEDGISLVRYTRTSMRPHNCYPEEMWLMWNFMKNFSFEVAEDGEVTRYYSASAFAEDDKVKILEFADPLQEEVVSIQATTAPNFYGHKVETVVIEFAEDVDAEALAAAEFTLYDRGFQAPYFAEVEIVDVKVAGNVVTLTIDQGTDKTADRSRDTIGTLCTSSNWFIDSEGNIYYGKEESRDELGNTIHPNTIKKGLQRRNLDLILCINDTDITVGLKSTDGVGNMLEDTVWQETILGGGLDEVEQLMINVGWDAPNYTMINNEGEAFVPVDVIWPEGYDADREEAYPVIFYQCGGGVCYWENTTDLLAPANNRGCNVVYDTMMTEWHKLVPEAIIISVNVHSAGTENSAAEIIGVLKYFIANYNADADKIVGVGNSQGTIITSDVIRQAPELITAYIPCNGDLGQNTDASKMDNTLANSTLKKWTEAEVQAMVDNNVAVWLNNGETDGNNPAGAQDIVEILRVMYAEAGKSEEWIFNHVRLSGYQSWKFKEWGETDHSATKVVAWYYLANVYDDVYEGKEDLAIGDSYKITSDPEYSRFPYIDDFDYTVYEESIATWVQNLFAGKYEPQE